MKICRFRSKSLAIVWSSGSVLRSCPRKHFIAGLLSDDSSDNQHFNTNITKSNKDGKSERVGLEIRLIRPIDAQNALKPSETATFFQFFSDPSDDDQAQKAAVFRPFARKTSPIVSDPSCLIQVCRFI
jgi:hypothetical protein